MECRVCYSSHKFNLLRNICKCKGTIGCIHLQCLYKCENIKKCEICHSEFNIGIFPRMKHFVVVTMKENKKVAMHTIAMYGFANMAWFVFGVCTALYF